MTRHRSFPIIHFLLTGVRLSAEIARVGRVAFRSHASLVAENLFLRKQLAFYEERKIKPHRLRDAARLALVFWSRWFDWKNALVAVTLHFRVLYVFVVMEVGSRKLLHVNAKPCPTSSWTLQQLREAIPSDHGCRWLIHDRSGVFSEDLDRSIEAMGIEVLKTPVRAPKANAYCERLIGSLHRECLDWFIPMNERHLRMLAREWAAHYNQVRAHQNLGPGIPEPPSGLPVRGQVQRHEVPEGFVIKQRSVLGPLHHEYRLQRIAA